MGFDLRKCKQGIWKSDKERRQSEKIRTMSLLRAPGSLTHWKSSEGWCTVEYISDFFSLG